MLRNRALIVLWDHCPVMRGIVDSSVTHTQTIWEKKDYSPLLVYLYEDLQVHTFILYLLEHSICVIGNSSIIYQHLNDK